MNTKNEILTIIHVFKRYCYIINSTIKLIKCHIYINYNFIMYKKIKYIY